jgi:hypothetical protein
MNEKNTLVLAMILCSFGYILLVSLNVHLPLALEVRVANSDAIYFVID